MQFFTVDELAEILKIPGDTLRKYLREGYLKGHKIGKEWRVSKEQLDEFLKNNERG